MSDKKLPPIPDYPKESKAPAIVEGVVAIAEFAGDAVPGVGFTKDRLLDRYVRGPLEKKREEFHNRIAVGLARLEASIGDFDPRNLEEDEEFLAAVYAATQSAMRTASADKREALCNVVLNIAAGMKLDEVLYGAFMGYVETFSALHIEVLRIFDEPSRLLSLARPGEVIHGPVKSIIAEKLVPHSASQQALDRVLEDLENAGMIATTYEVVVSQDRSTGSTLKPAGSAFMQFISKPKQS